MFKKLFMVICIFALCLIFNNAEANSFLFIGDSRFVGMEYQADDSDNILFLAESGRSHDFYFENHDYVNNYTKDTVIFYNLGVNGLDDEGCVEALNDLKNLGFTNIYFIAVGPVDEETEAEHGYSTRNADIIEFNEYVKNHLPAGVKYIDSYSFLINSGFDTYDGLHYTGTTYRQWYEQILTSI